jgi:hypothetical protein
MSMQGCFASSRYYSCSTQYHTHHTIEQYACTSHVMQTSHKQDGAIRALFQGTWKSGTLFTCQTQLHNRSAASCVRPCGMNTAGCTVQTVTKCRWPNGISHQTTGCSVAGPCAGINKAGSSRTTSSRKAAVGHICDQMLLMSQRQPLHLPTGCVLGVLFTQIYAPRHMIKLAALTRVCMLS